MNNKTVFLMTMLAAMFFCRPPSAGAQLALVEDGIGRAPIVVFAGAPPMIRRAADELADYLEKITGARLPVIEGQPDPLPEHAIWVGYQPVLDEIFPDIDFEFGYPEEILIVANDRHLAVAGRDRWREDFLTVAGRNWTIEGLQQEYGTVNAVYTLLQDYLGVRWLMPGELGVDIAERKTIALTPFEYRYHPQFRLRSNLFRLSELGDSRGASHDWARFQRLQLDSMQMETGGHATDTWWNRFHETNPEFFALQPDGKRSGFPGPTLVKRCKSNPALWEQWLDDVEAELKENPSRRVFTSGINDSYNRGHCVCENCLAWDNQDAVRLTYAWEGLVQQYVALSDRHVTFYNQLARGLRERFPDRDDLYVSGGGYGNWRSAPVAARPEKNVLIVSVANFFLAHGVAREESMTQFRDWSRFAAQQTWRPNIGDAGGWAQGLPDVALRQAMEDFRFIAEHGAIGLAFDTVWEHWANHAPLYYLMGQLAWNPWLDGEAVLRDYYRRSYGPAAGEMEAYWNLLEEARTRHRAEGRNLMTVHETYTPELLARARALIDAARGRLAVAPEIYRRRLDFTAAGLEYTGLVAECADLIRHVRAKDDRREEAEEKIRANWKRMVEIHAAQPLAFRSRAPFRMEALNPDTYK